MNFLEAINFDTEAARLQVEDEDRGDEKCSNVHPMAAYEVIDLLHIQLVRLMKIEQINAEEEMSLNEQGISAEVVH